MEGLTIVRLCELCGIELFSNEKGYCSLCVSSGEHIGDLGWDEIGENPDA